MAFRDYLSGKLAALLAPIIIYSCGTGNVNNQYCGSDMDCGAYQICSLAGTCIQEGTCVVDLDCGGNLVCENYACVKAGTDPNKIYGGTTPEETWNQFQNSLKNGTLEEVVQYFDPLVREKYKGILSTANLSNLGDQLNGAALHNCITGQRFKECSFGADEKVQFMLYPEKGVQVYKIKGL